MMLRHMVACALALAALVATVDAQSVSRLRRYRRVEYLIESQSSTTVRNRPNAGQIAAFMTSSRARFTFPAPYNTTAYRLTIPADCSNGGFSGADCVSDIGYGYWRRLSNSGSTLYAFVTLQRSLGGIGPSIIAIDKTTGVVSAPVALFDAADDRSNQTGEIWYFSAAQPTKLYVQPTTVSPTLTRYDIVTHVTTTVFDISSAAGIAVFGAGKYIKQIHTSSDDNVHSFTVANSSTFVEEGCGTYKESTATFAKPHTATALYDECQIDQSGRYLVVKDNVVGVSGIDTVVHDLQTSTSVTLADPDGGFGHSDVGYGYALGVDDFTSPGPWIRRWTLSNFVAGASTVVHTDLTYSAYSVEHISHRNAVDASPSGQFACGSGILRATGPRVGEITCWKLDGSTDVLVVAPVMTDLDSAGGGDDYRKLPKGNLDSTGRYFIWTSNLNSGRLDAFVVEIPSTSVTP